MLGNMKQIYPKWIDEFSAEAYQLFAEQVFEGFQPIDFYHFLRYDAD